MAIFTVKTSYTSSSVAWGEDTTQRQERSIEAETPNEAYWIMIEALQGTIVRIDGIEGYKQVEVPFDNIEVWRAAENIPYGTGKCLWIKEE